MTTLRDGRRVTTKMAFVRPHDWHVPEQTKRKGTKKGIDGRYRSRDTSLPTTATLLILCSETLGTAQVWADHDESKVLRCTLTLGELVYLAHALEI